MKKKVKTVILAMSLVLMSPWIASAIIADLTIQYQQVPKTTIQLILTLPALTAIISALATGFVSRVIDRKTISLFCLCIMFLGGMTFLFFNSNFTILLIASMLIGVGQGGLLTMTTALAAAYFEGEESGAVLGLQSAFITGGGMLLMFFGGLLAGIKWNYSYIVFFAVIPIFLLTAVLLPKDHMKAKKDALDQQSQKGRLHPKVFFYCLVVLVFSLCNNVFIVNISLFITGQGLGNATTSGMANTVLTAFGCLAGITYARNLRLFKQYLLMAGSMMPVIGFLAIYLTGSIAAVFIAAVCSGYAMSIIMPTSLFKASAVVSPDYTDTAVAMVNASTNIGTFVSPLIINSITLTAGLEGEAPKFLIGAILLIVLAGATMIEGVRLEVIKNILIK